VAVDHGQLAPRVTSASTTRCAASRPVFPKA
jgi:hypothetical protein